MKISINKIAELAGVSKTTVSFVLNGRGDEKNISQVTQKKIIDIAQQNNYQANFIARSLSIGRTYTIGFIVPDISNPFYGNMIKHIEFYAEKRGYSVMVASTGEDINKEIKLLESFKARQIDGVIVASAAKSYNQHCLISEFKLATVFFDRIFKEQNIGFVDINNQETAYKLTQILINRGHSKIGLISLTSYLPNIKNRILGFKDALKQNGICINDQQIIEIKYDDIRNQMKLAINKMIQNEIKAIIFLNNVLAAEGIWTINTFYPELIDDFDFASFDHLPLFDYSKPTVISAVQPIKEIANKSVEILCNEIENGIIENGVSLKASIKER